MVRMAGWREGEPLGLRGWVCEPVPTPSPNRHRRGLGWESSSNSGEASYKHDDFRATRWEGDLIYGTYDEHTATFTKYALSVKGTPTVPLASYSVPEGHVTGVVWWGEGIGGPAPITYPHPKGWAVVGPDCMLDQVSVKLLTRAFLMPSLRPPTCVTVWAKLLGELDWRAIGLKYKELLLTPKDFMPHFKCILHRAFLTRRKNKARRAVGDVGCRLCSCANESLSHFPNCPVLKPLFTKLARLHYTTLPVGAEWDRLVLLGVSSPPLPRAISDLHLVLWKFILINLTQRDLHNKPFDPQTNLARSRPALRVQSQLTHSQN